MRLWAVFSVLCSPVFAGCGSLSTTFDGLGEYDPNSGAEQAFPSSARTGEGVTGVWVGGDVVWDVPYEVRAGMAISGGDMVLGTEAEVTQRSAPIGVEYRKWPSCEVAYSISEDVAQPVQQAFRDAIATWEASTPLRFHEDVTAPDRVAVVRGDGCFSEVGYQGGVQEMSLDDDCGSGAIHELGHAVGLWHEQARTDALDYVAFNLDLVPTDKHHNFQTYADRGQPGVDHGEYDFDSVMHYHPRAFSSGRCNPVDLSGCSMTLADGGYLRAGQRSRLSEGDIAGVSSMYDDCGSSTDTGDVEDIDAVVDTGGFGLSSPMFSRYLEGSSGNNKYVEVANPSTQTADLQGCTVELYRNGATSPASSLALSGTLQPDQTFLLCHTSAELPTGGDCDLASGSLSFNGDDALVLTCSGSVADRIGQVGVDPGTAWLSGGVSTRDASLERVCGSAPQLLPGEAFDPGADWVARPTDDASGLGTPWACQ